MISNRYAKYLALTLLVLIKAGCQPAVVQPPFYDLLFCADRAVYAASIEQNGQVQTRQVLALSEDSTCPMWSPDGNLGLLYRLRQDALIIQDSLSLIERRSGVVQEVYRFGPRDAEWLFRWLSDGVSLLMLSARDYQGPEDCSALFTTRSFNGTECWRNYTNVYLTDVHLQDGLVSFERLTALPAPRCDLAWSADGQKIAYTRGAVCQGGLLPPGDVDILDLQTRDLMTFVYGTTDATNPSTINYSPQWAPDGKTILFTAWSIDEHTQQRLVADADSLEIRLVTPEGVPGDLAPDGEKIVWRTDDTLGVTYLESGESQEWQVSRGALCLMRPQSWSPDSRRFAWIECQDGRDGLYVLDLETAQITTLTDLAPESFAWSTDGNWLAFSNRTPVEDDTCEYRIDVYIVKPDGTNLRNITEGQLMCAVPRGPAGWMGYRYYAAAGDVQWVSPSNDD